MREKHARSTVCHDGFNALLGISSLTLNGTILTVTFVVERTSLGSSRCSFYGLTTFAAKACLVLCCARMVFFAIHTPHSLEGFQVLLLVTHNAPYMTALVRSLIAKVLAVAYHKETADCSQAPELANAFRTRMGLQCSAKRVG